MPCHLSLVTILVDDYDAAIAWYTKNFGFELKSNEVMSETKRWVVVGPSNPNSFPMTDLLLAKDVSAPQQSQIGNQAGGRVGFFLSTDNFEQDYDRMKQGGVEFLEVPRKEPYGIVVQLKDLYGNKWDLIQRFV